MSDATPWIAYDWPADGADPFDAAAPDPLWLLADGAGHWGRAWPAGDLRDFGSYGDFEQRVPMGYKVVEVRERIALMRDGELVHAGARSSAVTWFGQWGAVGHLAYAVHPQHWVVARSREERTERRAACPTEDEALAAAARLSLAEPEETWLVSRRIAIRNWH